MLNLEKRELQCSSRFEYWDRIFFDVKFPSGEPVKTSCEKRKLKYEFRLLNDILAKSVTVKAGSFDAVTHELFVLMTAIHFELKGDPAVTLEEATTFPPLKILSAKTVSTYVTTNKTIDARGESDEPNVAEVAVVKRKSVSKKISASTADKDTDEVHVEIVSPAVKKKRTTMGRAAPVEKDLALVTVAQDAVPIQIVEPISVVPTELPHAKKCKAPKRKLRLSTGSDDEIVEKEPDVENVVEKKKEQTTVDDVDNIIEQVIAETAQMETDVVEPDIAEGVAMGTDLTVMEEDSVKNKDTYIQLVESATGKEIDPDPVEDVGQIPFDEDLRRLAVLKSLQDIVANEEQVLTWGETYSVQVALQRRFFGQPRLAMALQIIELLSTAHSTTVQNLLTQKQAIKLEWTRPCCATLFQGANVDRGFYIPRNHKPSSLRAGFEICGLLKDLDPIVQVDADSVFVNQVVQMEEYQRPDPTESYNFSQRIPDIALQSPGQSNSAHSRMLFTAADIPLYDETSIDQLMFPATALPAPDLANSLAQLRTSVSQLSIKQMRTTSRIGDLRNELLSKIDNIAKAAAEARIQQDHVFRDLIKSVKQEVQLQKTSLSLEMIEFKKGLRAHSAILTTDQAYIQKEMHVQKMPHYLRKWMIK
ncbi:hypothetical protein F511_19442 [Dorcoceras hygrometricum]|uniref:Uncharacterized protein n=1 Tax=Dorcoceras hygrometricum TaxID=472368 RepID=A0A2Z7DGQ9_9LAMI|nr:hypothetical protein F511_19442 [Dorcoceras hygrometricum]